MLLARDGTVISGSIILADTTDDEDDSGAVVVTGDPLPVIVVGVEMLF